MAGVNTAVTRLHTSLLLSALLHAVIFLFAWPTMPALSAQKTHALQVQLADHAQTTAAVTPKTPQVRHPIHATKSVTPATPPAPSADDAAHLSATAPAVPTVDDTEHAAVAAIEARLHADLARHFDYPTLARLRGWEGRVMLAFDVESDGRLQKIHLAHSSGFALLDDSALRSLRRVERIAEAVDLLQGRRLAMQIPVIYRLQGDR